MYQGLCFFFAFLFAFFAFRVFFVCILSHFFQTDTDSYIDIDIDINVLYDSIYIDQI